MPCLFEQLNTLPHELGIILITLILIISYFNKCINLKINKKIIVLMFCLKIFLKNILK